MKIGFGFDSHRLVEGRPLVLGGVEIDFPKGLLGHSDGDCVLHAVCDAILGAIGGGDIGELFPDTDSKWKDAASSTFLETVAKMISQQSHTISNIDVTVIASQPSISSHKRNIKENIASILGISPDRINVKAKRPEGFEDAAADVIAACAITCVE